MTEPAQLTLDAWMTQREIDNIALAAATGYDRTSVWRIRTGLRRPTGDFQLQFSRVFGRAAAHDLWPDVFPPMEAEA